MDTWKRREFVAWGMGALTTAIAPDSHCATPGSSRIRAAVLGIGHAHAAGKTRILRESPDFELAGVCEPDEELRRQYGGGAAYQGVPWLSIGEVLNDPSVQLVAVESRVQENLAYARQAIGAGKHLHLDKPPGNDLERLRAILDEADRRNLAVQMGYMWRYNPGMQVAIEAARKGWLGKIYMCRGIISSDIAPAARPALALFPGGMMFELGCHLIDRMVDLLGRPSKVTPFLCHASPYKDGLADNSLAVFEYDQALAEIYSTAQQPSGGNHRLFQIQGTNGTATLQPIEPPSLEIDLKAAAGPYGAGRQKVEIRSDPRYVADFREMAQVIRKQRSVSFSAKHDLLVQETLLRSCGAH